MSWSINYHEFILECQAITHETYLSNRKIPTLKHLKRGIFYSYINKVSAF